MTRPLWTWEAFLSATGGRPVGPAPEAVTGVSIDSRTIRPGDAFFAIHGDKHDGHDFVSIALGAGAATAVVSEDRLSALGRVTGSLTVVGDVLAALTGLGLAGRLRSTARIAAVTGSVGKTSTKEMLAHALAPEGSVHFSPASFNNHWGVPLTLARMPREARYGIFEIGMNHAGEIEPLTRMVRPHVAIVTAVEPVHLEYFNSVEDIARAKAEIFLGVEPGGAAIINRDNPHYRLLAESARAAGVERIVGFGEHPDAEVRLTGVSLRENISCIAATVLGEEVSYKLGAPGRHLVQNSLAVLGTVSLLGGDLAQAAMALAGLAAGKGRGQRQELKVPGGTAILIDESYNANPASMNAAIALLGQTEPGRNGRRIAILGDMLELGRRAQAMHAGLAAPLAEADVDAVFLVGPLMRSLWDALPVRLHGGYTEKASDMEPLVAEAIAPGDVIMVKGSNASRMGPLVETIKARFAPAKAAKSVAQEQDRA
jgi:UDP-N-acetylmuramoyl-tripeptide--D-alanyl-D-alanine ligase